MHDWRSTSTVSRIESFAATVWVNFWKYVFKVFFLCTLHTLRVLNVTNMGNSESKPEVTEKVPVFKSKYNWILSYPMRVYESVGEKLLAMNSTDVLKKYVDLRVNCPPVLDVGNVPLHPIATVCSLLNYQLNRNKLSTFPPHACSFIIIVLFLKMYDPYYLSRLYSKPSKNLDFVRRSTFA